MIGGDIGHQDIGKTKKEDGQQGSVPSANTNEFSQDTIEDDSSTETKEQDDCRSDIQGTIDTC